MPASGKTLAVDNAGNYTLTAGESIILKPGFHAKAGSQFVAKIDPNMDIEIQLIGNIGLYIDPLGAPSELCIQTKNADSWEFVVKNIMGVTIWATAGNIVNNQACIWDGSGVTVATVCEYNLRLKNSYGRVKSVDGSLSVLSAKPQLSPSQVNGEVEFPEEYIISDIITMTEDNFAIKVFPNPTSGKVYVLANTGTVKQIEIKNIQGITILQYINMLQNEIIFDISAQPAGFYFLTVKTKNGGQTYKIVKN